MKRFHVHLAVEDLAQSLRFYTALFGAPPSVEKTDYAKWLLDDPRVNFAISARGHAPGVNHLGFQVDSDAELGALRERVAAADIAVLDQTGAACCYARSDKHWVQDPQGLAWESFHTLADVPVFGSAARETASGGACCVPEGAPARQGDACGGARSEPATAGACCP